MTNKDALSMMKDLATTVEFSFFLNRPIYSAEKQKKPRSNATRLINVIPETNRKFMLFFFFNSKKINRIKEEDNGFFFVVYYHSFFCTC